MARTILWNVADQVVRRGSAPALRFGNATITYAELWDETLAIFLALEEGSGNAEEGGQSIILLTERSVVTYAGVLAIMLSGNVCVPLTPRVGAARAVQIVAQSGARTVVVDAGCHALLEQIVASSSEPLNVLYAEEDEVPQHARVRGAVVDPTGSERAPWKAALERIRGESLAYLLFTSGSTGVPKGVPVSHLNLAAYCERVLRELRILPDDRASQFFEPTFDLFMHDLFVTLASGASLCVPSEQDLMNPAAYVNHFEVSSWFSVPYLGKLVCQQLGSQWAAMQSLRTVLFCGEALPRHVAAEWMRRLAQPELYNLYGPTEATIAFSIWRYRDECKLATLPIGRPMHGLEMLVYCPERGDVAADGIVGEIWLGGDQVVSGYFDDADRTSQSFIERSFEPRASSRWYRTGDLGAYDAAEGFIFHGRADFQVKIRGYRVELGEVETVVQSVLGLHTATVVPWPVDADGGALGLVAVAAGYAGQEHEFLTECSRRLTSYMRPTRLLSLPELPLGPSGKVDVKAIRLYLEEERKGCASVDGRSASPHAAASADVGHDVACMGADRTVLQYVAGIDAREEVQ